MNRHSSFTSSSERPSSKRRAATILLWVMGWLIALDVATNVLFAYPRDPKATSASQLQLYFDYGRSMEGKLARITRADPDQTAPITLAGWYQPLKAVEHGTGRKGETVTIYGMSHAVRLAEALERTSPRFHARSVGAPGATANWSYGAFLRDADRSGSKAVVLAIMSSTLPMITTMSPLTWNISFAMPYTADRYYATPEGLRVARPPYDSFDGFVAAFQDPGRWKAARQVLRQHDAMYDDLLVRASPLDHSALVRLLRRAYQQRQQRMIAEGVITPRGFNPASEQVKVANAIVADFARHARSQGLIPVIFVVNSFGYSDHLYRALEPTLQRDAIPVLSSHRIVSPSDPSGYLPDSHFTDNNDNRLAEALAEIIAMEQAKAERRAPGQVGR